MSSTTSRTFLYLVPLFNNAPIRYKTKRNGTKRNEPKQKILPVDEEAGVLRADPALGFEHPFPPTRVAFVPDRSGSVGGAPSPSSSSCLGNAPDLLATSGDFLRIWKIESGGDDVHGTGMATDEYEDGEDDDNGDDGDDGGGGGGAAAARRREGRRRRRSVADAAAATTSAFDYSFSAMAAPLSSAGRLEYPLPPTTHGAAAHVPTQAGAIPSS